MEHENKRSTTEAIQRSCQMQNLHLKVDLSQQGASSPDNIPPWGADSISHPKEAEKTTRGRGLTSFERPAFIIYRDQFSGSQWLWHTTTGS
jgi:hypothetical protein